MKRFTETNKWEKPWFRKLPPGLKCLWLYLCDRCDCAGVIDFDPALASFQIGTEVTLEDLQKFGDRLEVLPNGKLFIRDFVEFQYGELSTACPPHRNIFKALAQHGIPVPGSSHSGTNTDRVTGRIPDRVSGRVAVTLQEKEKDTDKEKDKDKEPATKSNRFSVPGSPNAAPCIPSALAGIPEFVAEWGHFLRHRSQLGRKMTQRAQELMLRKLAERPPMAVQALQMAQLRGWQGFEWEWMENQHNAQHHPPNGAYRSPASQGFHTNHRPVHTI